MNYRFITTSSLLVPITTHDALFSGRYTIDPYQHCEFRCRYCDSSTNETVYVKSNAVQLLEKEIQHLPTGMIILGSVHDPYQHAEQKYEITRAILQHLQQYDFPVHILTKSSLVVRDIDILSKLKHCRVTLSISSLKPALVTLLEPLAPSSQNRLHAVKKLSEHNIKSGVALMPIIPYLIDGEIEQIIEAVAHAQAHYLLHTFLELKGDQKEVFLEFIKTMVPNCLEQIKTLYQDNTKPDESYTKKTSKKINDLCNKNNLETVII